LLVPREVLLDANLSPRLVKGLIEAGYGAIVSLSPTRLAVRPLPIEATARS
jgi:hypothetical protein